MTRTTISRPAFRPTLRRGAHAKRPNALGANATTTGKVAAASASCSANSTTAGLLMGLDLDRCFEDNGDFKPWAVDVLTRINSYAEVSPSGSGTKQFFLVAAEDAEAVKRLLGKNTKGEPATRKSLPPLTSTTNWPSTARASIR